MSYVKLKDYPDKDALVANAYESMRVVIERAKRGGKSWDRIIDLDNAIEVVAALASGQEDLGIEGYVINGSHLLLASRGKPWWGKGEWLVEQFYVRIGKGSADEAMASIDQLGKDLGMDLVIMGTSLAPNDEALGKLLAKYGYSPQSSQHIKEL